MKQLEIKLLSTSPLSFEVAKLGDTVEIRYSPPKKNEYRASIGRSLGGFLVFKGQTKIGLIPKDIVTEYSELIKTARRGTVVASDGFKKILIIRI